MAEDPTPNLRADATDDQDELEPEIRVPARELKDVTLLSVSVDAEPGPYATGGVVTTSAGPGDDSVPIILDNGYIVPKGVIPNPEDAPDGEDGTVDPADPGATGSNGVIHGGR
jgi:hypothetical protein